MDRKNSIDVGYYPDIKTIEYENDYLNIDLMFPNYDKPSGISLGLCATRAADNIRIHYDYDRDGWAILQDEYLVDEDEQPFCSHVENWQEVAFIQAWARERIVKEQ